MTFTSKEQAIYNYLADYATQNDCVGFAEIASELGIPTTIARGVVSSLLKKDLVLLDGEPGVDIVWAKHRTLDTVGFWCDYISRKEALESRITDDEVAE